MHLQWLYRPRRLRKLHALDLKRQAGVPEGDLLKSACLGCEFSGLESSDDEELQADGAGENGRAGGGLDGNSPRGDSGDDATANGAAAAGALAQQQVGACRWASPPILRKPRMCRDWEGTQRAKWARSSDALCKSAVCMPCRARPAPGGSRSAPGKRATAAVWTGQGRGWRMRGSRQGLCRR